MFRIESRTTPMGVPMIRRCLVVLAMSLAAGCSNEAAIAPPASAAVSATAVQPERGSITRSVTLPGQVLAARQATLYARVAGYLRSIRVDKGDHVDAGELLAQVEVPELEAARARQQAELMAAESDYTRLRDSLAKAPDLVVPQMVDQARGKYEVAKAGLQQSDTMLGYATIAAPFAGVVTQRLVDPGALIPAGGGTAVVTLMDFSSVRVQIAVPEQEASHVVVGQPVLVTTEDLPGTSLDGKITRFAYALDPATRTMLAEVMLPNPELKLRPGMLVSVKLGIQRHDDALLLPVAAVVTDKSGTYCWRLVDGKAQKGAVKTGFNDGKQVEITEGVGAGDTVILAGKLSLKDGQAVQVTAGP